MRYSPQEVVTELDREIGMRRSVYPGLIKSGKLTTEAAEKRIGIMQMLAAEHRRKIAANQPALLAPEDPTYPVDEAKEIIETAVEDANL